MTKLNWKALVPFVLLAPQLVTSIPAFDEDTSVEVQNRGLEDRVPACANIGTCVERRGDDPKDHTPDDEDDDTDKDDGDEDGEVYINKDEKGEDPAKDSPEDYGDYGVKKDKRDLVERAKYLIRNIPAILKGKLPREAWMADNKRKSFTIKRLNTEKDKNKPAKYKWKTVKASGVTYEHTEVDHVLEIQRLQFIYEPKEPPHGAGSRDAWEKMRKAVSEDTPNDNKDKIAVAHTLNANANLRGLHERINALKGIVTKMSQKKSKGPDYKGKWARSTVWGLARFFKATKKQYEETASKVKDLIKDITDDSDQAEYVEKKLKDLLDVDVKHTTEQAKEKKGKNGEKFDREDMEDIPKV